MKILQKRFCILILIFALFTSCAIDSLKQAVKDISDNGFHAPKWDLDVNISMIDKKVSVKELVEDESLLGSIMSGMHDSSFDQVKTTDLKLGGKYYYPEQNNFGLRAGDYVINYPISFPGSDNMINGAINASMIEQFTNNFVFKLDDIPLWPIPTPIDVTVDLTGSPFGNISSANIDLSSLNIDINGDHSNDIVIKGVESDNAKLSLRFYVVKKNKTTDETVDIIVPDASSIVMDSISIEGHKYKFDAGVKKNKSTNPTDFGLYYTAKDFITVSSGDHQILFNGIGDNTNDFSHLDVDGFNFTIKKNLTTGTPDAENDYKIMAEVSLDFGDNYNVICDINEMTFNLNTISYDLSMLGQFDSTSDIDNLGSYFISNLSLQYAGIYFDALSTLPLDIDMSTLFDSSIGGIEINLPDGPINHEVDGDGAIITYFDMNGDNQADKYELLSFKDPTQVRIEAFTDTGSSSVEKRFALYHTNSNIDKVLETEDTTNDKIRRPKNIFFVSYFETLRSENKKLGVRNLQGGISIKSGLVIPISIKIMEDKEPQDLLKAFDMDDALAEFGSFLTSDTAPIEDIKSLGFKVYCENYLPLGMTIDFVVSADTSDDKTLYFSLVKNEKSKMVINHGELVKSKESPDYYISTSSKGETLVSVDQNFKYNIKKTSTGEIISENNKYDGSFVDFVKQYPNLKFGINFSLLESKQSKGSTEHIAVRISSDNYVKLKVDLVGSATLDFDKLMQ